VATKPEGQATGLGLASIYGTVTQSSGLVRLESEPGEGTTVELYFPLAPKLAAVAVSEPEHSRRRPQTVLVAEDEDIDVLMEPLGGIEVARRALSADARVRIVLYTGHRDRTLLDESRAVGASGIVLKEGSLAELEQAVRDCVDGRTYFDHRLVRQRRCRATGKLDADTRTEAVATALRRSLIA
jgi:hypothetical protein